VRVRRSGAKGERDGGRLLFVVARRHGRRGKGQGGPGFGAVWRGKTEEGSSSVRGWVGDVGWHGMDAAALTVASGACIKGAGCEQGRTAAHVRRDSAADRSGRATSRPGGNGRGAGGSVSERGSMAWGTD
jgi:hypothetical protein